MLGPPQKWTRRSIRGASASARSGPIPGEIIVTPESRRVVDFTVAIQRTISSGNSTRPPVARSFPTISASKRTSSWLRRNLAGTPSSNTSTLGPSFFGTTGRICPFFLVFTFITSRSLCQLACQDGPCKFLYDTADHMDRLVELRPRDPIQVVFSVNTDDASNVMLRISRTRRGEWHGE